jgi:hypothetical protein
MLFDCLRIKNYIDAEFTAGVIPRQKDVGAGSGSPPKSMAGKNVSFFENCPRTF